MPIYTYFCLDCKKRFDRRVEHIDDRIVQKCLTCGRLSVRDYKPVTIGLVTVQGGTDAYKNPRSSRK